MIRKITLLLCLGISGYLCYEWIMYFRSIEVTGNHEFVGFLYFVGGYFLVLVLLVVIGRLVFLFNDVFSKRIKRGNHKLYIRAIYLVLFLLFWLVVRWTFSDEEQFVPENMLLSGVAIAIVIISKKLFEASRQKQMQLFHEKNRKQAELSLLKTQVNPHFLFNALNTLYNDSLKAGADQITANLEKLTDILRYQLQYAARETISLETEVNFIRQYVDFQKHRFRAEDLVVIEMEVKMTNSEAVIHPMILITYIENAFKHGISREQASSVSIQLHQKADLLSLQVANTNYPKHGKTSTGIGLEQTQRLLSAYYPDFQYSAQVKGEEYRVDLKINLKSHD